MRSSNMRLSAIVDFYYLEYLDSVTYDGLNAVCKDVARNVHACNKLKQDIKEAKDSLHLKLGRALHDYMFVACSAEARYAVDKCEDNIGALSGHGRYGACNEAMDHDPESSLLMLVTLFNDCYWNTSSYGGESWGDIAEAALFYYQTESLSVFIDHVLDVYHNGGSLFDKWDAADKVSLTVDSNRHTLIEFLDFKFAFDIIRDFGKARQSVQDLIIKGLSSTVSRLLWRYHVIYHNVYPPQWIRDTVGTDYTDYEPVDFGNKVYKLCESYIDECENCGCALDDSMCEYNNDKYCEDCYCGLFVQCESCYEVFSNDDIIYHNNMTLCEHCIEEYPQCEECSEYQDETDTKMYHNNEVCHDCAEDLGYLQYCESCDAEVEVEEPDEIEHVLCHNCEYWLDFDPHPYLESHSNAQIFILDYIRSAPGHLMLSSAQAISWMNLYNKVESVSTIIYGV